MGRGVFDDSQTSGPAETIVGPGNGGKSVDDMAELRTESIRCPKRSPGQEKRKKEKRCAHQSEEYAKYRMSKKANAKK